MNTTQRYTAHNKEQHTGAQQRAGKQNIKEGSEKAHNRGHQLKAEVAYSTELTDDVVRKVHWA